MLLLDDPDVPLETAYQYSVLKRRSSEGHGLAIQVHLARLGRAILGTFRIRI